MTQSFLPASMGITNKPLCSESLASRRARLMRLWSSAAAAFLALGSWDDQYRP